MYLKAFVLTTLLVISVFQSSATMPLAGIEEHGKPSEDDNRRWYTGKIFGDVGAVTPIGPMAKMWFPYPFYGYFGGKYYVY